MSGVSTFLVIIILTQLVDHQTRKFSGPYLPRNLPTEKRGQGQQIPQKYLETLWYSRSSSLRGWSSKSLWSIGFAESRRGF